MKKDYFITLVILISLLVSCSPRVVDKINISDLIIDELEVNSDSVPDSLFVNSIILSLDDMLYDKHHDCLTKKEVYVDSITLSNANGDSAIFNPNIKHIQVDKFIIEKGKKYKYNTDNAAFEIDRYLIKKMLINSTISHFNPNVLLDSVLNSNIDLLKIKIDSLKDIILNLIENIPTHAGATLLQSSEFRAIEKVLSQAIIYQRSSHHSIEMSEYHIERLLDASRIAQNLIAAITSPLAEPMNFSTNVFFELGSYKLKDRISGEFDEYIEKIINYKPDNEFKMKVLLTGYSDDIGFSSLLRKDLKSLFPDSTCERFERENQCLNFLLSCQRAKNIKKYIESKIGSINDKIELSVEYIGKGEEYPHDIDPNSCSGNCPQRRRVSISTICTVE